MEVVLKEIGPIPLRESLSGSDFSQWNPIPFYYEEDVVSIPLWHSPVACPLR